ncbi:MAG TPA: hypothetical protein VGD78_18440 [Chthoniobacterales bacterium]
MFTSIKEILEVLPKLTQEEKRQLWNVLDHGLPPDAKEERPALLAAFNESIRSLENGLESLVYHGSKVKKRPGVLKLVHGNYLIYRRVNEAKKTVEVLSFKRGAKVK